MDRLVQRALSRARARLPEAALQRAIRARSLFGGGPLIATMSAHRILVLAPHPDDETIAAGGSLCLAVARGAKVTVAIATDGEASRGTDLSRTELATRRREDAGRAAGILGLTDVRFLGHTDGALADDLPALVEDIRRLLVDLDPQVIVLPWWDDDHRDHRTLNDALVAAGCEGREIWGAEVWTPAPVNRLVDITSVVERKQAALAAHVAASDAFDVTATLGLNRYRSVHGLLGTGYAEGFTVLPGERYAACVRASR